MFPGPSVRYIGTVPASTNTGRPLTSISTSPDFSVAPCVGAFVTTCVPGLAVVELVSWPAGPTEPVSDSGAGSA